MTAVVVLSPEELRALLEQAAERGAKRALAESAAPSPACDWIGADEAAKLVGVKRDYLRRLDVPRHGSRRAPRYRRSEVEAWIVARGRAA